VEGTPSAAPEVVSGHRDLLPLTIIGLAISFRPGRLPVQRSSWLLLGGRPGGTEASDRAVLLPCRVVFASLLLYSVRPRSPAPLLRLAPLLDDWLKRDRFLFLGWSGLFLFPSAYLAASAWFFGTTFVTSFFTHGLSSSYIEGANPLAAAVSSPAGCPGHSLLLLWGREARGIAATAAWVP